MYVRPLARSLVAAGVVVGVLTAALTAASVVAPRPAGADAAGERRAAAASGAPPMTEETIAARSRFFGAENVDQRTGAVPAGEVHLSWASVSTFAVAWDGHVLLLDAYLHKAEDRPNYVPATYQDLVDLAPEAILVGHGHFDHGLEAGTIAAATGATMVGTRSHCDQASSQVEADGGDPARLDCVAVFDHEAAFGETTGFELFDDVCTSAVLHVHSALEPPDPERGDPTNRVLPLPDAGSVLLHPPGFTLDGEGDEGGTVLYQLRTGDFTLTYHDSSGPLKERAPEVLEVLRDLPATDVQVGAILGFNQPTNGLRDPAMYVEAVDPEVFVPNHHDFVTEYGSADDFEPVLRRELDARGVDAEVRFLYDPYDYVRPNLLSFEVDADRWAGPAGGGCPRTRVGAGDGHGPDRPPATAALPLPSTGGGMAFSGLLVALGWGIGRRHRPSPSEDG